MLRVNVYWLQSGKCIINAIYETKKPIPLNVDHVL